MPYELEFCNNNKKWDEFVSNLLQGNIFCMSSFLNSWGMTSEKLFVTKNDQIMLGALLIDHKIKLVNPPIRYQGILFSKEISSFPNHKRVKVSLDLVEFLLDELTKKYDKINFSLFHTFEDLRAIQWLNYHEPEKGQFNINLKYTGILDISKIDNVDSLLMIMRTARRQAYRKNKKNGFTFEESDDADIFAYLQDLTYKRQGFSIEDNEKKLFLDLVDGLINDNLGRLLVCKDKDGKPAAASFFIFDKKFAYYLYGANDPDYRKYDTGTAIIIDQLIFFKEKGINLIDFCGINSPSRGDFKTSFNAQPIKFFELEWKKQ